MSRWQAFQTRMHANPATHHTWRVVVGVAGALVVALGLVLVPFPGPGWLIVFGGVGIWALEFAWAQRLRQWGLGVLREWTAWIARQALWVRGAVGLATAAFVAAVVLTSLWFTGVPGWLPDAVEEPLAGWLPAR